MRSSCPHFCFPRTSCLIATASSLPPPPSSALPPLPAACLVTSARQSHQLHFSCYYSTVHTYGLQITRGDAFCFHLFFDEVHPSTGKALPQEFKAFQFKKRLSKLAWARSLKKIMNALMRMRTDHWLITGSIIHLVEDLSITRIIEFNAEQLISANLQVCK